MTTSTRVLLTVAALIAVAGCAAAQTCTTSKPAPSPVAPIDYIARTSYAQCSASGDYKGASAVVRYSTDASDTGRPEGRVVRPQSCPQKFRHRLARRPVDELGDRLRFGCARQRRVRADPLVHVTKPGT